jgi:hypothetical protein
MLARVPSRSREKTSAVQSLWGALEQGGPRDPGFLVGGGRLPGVVVALEAAGVFPAP